MKLNETLDDKEVFSLFKKILPIILILFIVALALSNFFNKSEETIVIAQHKEYKLVL
ncbi:hypothetical protein ACMGD3_02535 [Lysinibacillus sphaericus]|uniref:hypothetical protein n=1 Tax=Lysinibacillus sphaericus TaxID=1421 RepID=UPI003F7A305B